MECRIAQPGDVAQWNSFVFAQTSGSFMQSWQWANIQNLLGNTLWRYVVEDGGKVVAVFCIVRRDLPFGRSWLYIPRGPIVADQYTQDDTVWACITKKLRDTASEQGSIFVRIDPAIVAYPNLLSGWVESERQVQPQHTLVLNLDISEEDLLASMHTKTRYNVGLAERKGVTVRFSTSLTDIDVFLHLSKEVSKRSRFSYHPDNYYRAMLGALASEDMFEIAIAEHEGAPLAAHLMVYAGNTATYVHGASSHEKRSLMAPQYLYWKTIQRAKAKGLRTFDFFGVAPEGAPSSHPWAGITRVKEGFGGTRISYAGARDLVISGAMYDVFNTARRIGGFLR